MYTVADGDELEIRMFLDPRNRDRPHGCEQPRASFDRTIARRMLGTDYKISQSIDIYSPDDGRKQVNYVNGVRTTTEWVTKTKGIPITKSCESGGYRIAFNHETVSSGEQKITNSKFVRLKVRASTVWRTDWRFDFTLVKNATLATMQADRESFITPGGFFESKSWDLADWVECEFERVTLGPVTIDDTLLHAMYDDLLGWQPDNEHNEWIRWLAPVIDPPQIDVFLTPGNMRLVHKFQRMLPRAREITVQEWRRLYHDCRGSITVRDKIDGERQLLVVMDRKPTVFRGGAIDREIKIQLPVVSEKLYVFDTEFWNGKWYILHALYIDGENLLDASDQERSDATNVFLKTKESDLLLASALISDRDGIKESVLTLWPKTDKSVLDQSGIAMPLDGLLVTLESQQGYWDQTVIKWKPPHEVTIDFVPIKCPDLLIGKIPYVAPPGQTLYILMVGCPDKLVNIPPHLRFPGLPSTRGYRLVPFCPPQRTTAHIFCDPNPSLEGTIVELIENKQWRFKKIRTDKRSIMNGGLDMGNNIVTAQDTYSKYFTPFRIEDLYGVVRFDRTTVPSGVIPPDCRHLILYRPPASLAPPRGIPNMLIVGPTDILGIPRIDEPRGSRVELPTAFIGGSPFVISYEIAPSGAKRWGRVMNIIVANGGTVVHLAPGEIPDCGLDFKLLKSPGEPGDFGDTKYPTWKRLIAGTKSMTIPEMHAENPHSAGNPEAGYQFKYSRQKTRDIMSVSLECKTTSLVQDPRRGEMLCYIEFLTKSQPGIAIYLAPEVDKRLKLLFPTHNFTDDPTKLELLIARTWDRTLLEKLAPRECLIYIEPGTEATFQMPKAKVMLIPYQRTTDLGVYLHVQGSAIREKWWTCQRAVWTQEMKFFHNTYRPSGFRSQEARPAELDGFDSCYDCRSELYILAKYCKLRKTDLMDTIESF